MFGGCCHDRQNEFNQNFVGENILIAFEIMLVVKSQKIKKLLL